MNLRIPAYAEYLRRKQVTRKSTGLRDIPELSKTLFPFQADVLRFALQTGRAGVFLETGLGKTLIQLEWARHVPGRKLILAPLAVAAQTVREGREKLGLDVHHSRDGKTNKAPITITNYERLDLFDLSEFDAVVLDESSILKSFMGKTKQALCYSFADYRWKLCCTATPAPNDHMELGNHSEFLNVMPSNEMLSHWFINDSMHFGNYRLKGHAVRPFWKWVASWAACISKPSDLGYDDGLFKLPPLTLKRHILDADCTIDVPEGMLFRAGECSATTLHHEKRLTLQERVDFVAQTVNQSSDVWIIWCETNAESNAFAAAVPDAVEIVGGLDMDTKEDRIEAFSTGKARVVITKPSITGFGLNWQHCHRVLFGSLSFSFESFYQAVRRSWRFGQKSPVEVTVLTSSTEESVWRAVERKMQDHEAMRAGMKVAAQEFAEGIHSETKLDYDPTYTGHLPGWLRSKTSSQRATHAASHMPA